MKGSGKGGNNRKNRQHFSKRKDEPKRHDRKKHIDNLLTDGKFEKSRVSSPQERPRWTAPPPPVTPVNSPDCPWCGKQIKDITTAISDKETSQPVHFDCVLARISSMENLEANDSVCYIGGGRFGVVHYKNPPDTRDFVIKKIYEWEVKEKNEKNFEWRMPIGDYF